MGYDHIIIGSGINSLVAAAMLSKAGKRVLVLERNNRLGGAIRTEQATAPGFTHDVMAATWVLFMTSPAGATLGPDLAAHGMEYCHTPHPTAVLRPNGEALVCSTDQAANIAAWEALAPGDGAAHARDVGGIEADAPFLFSLLGGNLWSWKTARLMWGQVRKRGLRGLAAWMGSALTPARGWLETTYQSPLVQALWAPWVLHCGLTPESTYSGQMGKVIAFALEAAGAPMIKGGSGAAVRAFRASDRGEGRSVPLQRRCRPRSWSVTARCAASASGRRRDCSAFGAGLGGARAACTTGLLKGVNLPEDAPRRENLPPRARQFPAALCAGRGAGMADPGAGSGGADPPGRRHRLRLEIRERGRARHAARNPHDLRRPAAPAGPTRCARRQGGPLAADPRRAARHQGRCGGLRSTAPTGTRCARPLPTGSKASWRRHIKGFDKLILARRAY
jgi:hypothetical protein